MDQTVPWKDAWRPNTTVVRLNFNEAQNIVSLDVVSSKKVQQENITSSEATEWKRNLKISNPSQNVCRNSAFERTARKDHTIMKRTTWREPFLKVRKVRNSFNQNASMDSVPIENLPRRTYIRCLSSHLWMIVGEAMYASLTTAPVLMGLSHIIESISHSTTDLNYWCCRTCRFKAGVRWSQAHWPPPTFCRRSIDNFPLSVVVTWWWLSPVPWNGLRRHLIHRAIEMVNCSCTDLLCNAAKEIVAAAYKASLITFIAKIGACGLLDATDEKYR